MTEFHDTTVRQRLEQWFRQPAGQFLFEQEQSALNQILPNIFGYHLVQVGSIGGEDLLSASRISHKVTVQLQEHAESNTHAGLVCSAESLPFMSDSVDVVFAPHVLEFTANPHKLLREMERMLIGDGHLILTGFNPLSLLGLWRVCLAWSRPGRGRPA